jgi:hypothetical protein
VLCDAHGFEISLDLDGFEITRILETLQKASPSTVLEVDAPHHTNGKNGSRRAGRGRGGLFWRLGAKLPDV